MNLEAGAPAERNEEDRDFRLRLDVQRVGGVRAALAPAHLPLREDTR
jgi:hypothetical protein